LRKIVGLVLLLQAFAAWGAQEAYINAFGGWAAHNQESMEDSSTRPTGLSYGIGLGRRISFYEFELNASSGKLTTDIEHDGRSNTLVQEQFQVSLALNFYLLRNYYVRMGYAITSLEQTTETEVTGASGEGLVKEYGLKDVKSDGLILGGGWVFGDFAKAKIYAQYDYYMLPDIKATQHLLSLGMRWFFQ
jgi:hypothetical protein